MRTFDTLTDLKAAHLQTGTLVQILNPSTIEGLVESSGPGIALASGNYFVPRADDIETITARRAIIYDVDALITGYKRDSSGYWQEDQAGEYSPVILHLGQVWWPDLTPGSLPGSTTSEYYTVTSVTPQVVGDTLTFNARDRLGTLRSLTYRRNDALSYTPSEIERSTAASFGTVDFADSPVAAQDGSGYLCDTTNGEVIINLPSTPAVNTYIAVGDYDGTSETNRIVVHATDGSPIIGLNEDFEITSRGVVYGFSYIDTTIGWTITVGNGSGSGGGGVDTPVLVNADTIADRNTMYSFDMTDNISKKLTLNTGVLREGDYLGISLYNWDGSTEVRVTLEPDPSIEWHHAVLNTGAKIHVGKDQVLMVQMLDGKLKITQGSVGENQSLIERGYTEIWSDVPTSTGTITTTKAWESFDELMFVLEITSTGSGFGAQRGTHFNKVKVSDWISLGYASTIYPMISVGDSAGTIIVHASSITDDSATLVTTAVQYSGGLTKVYGIKY